MARKDSDIEAQIAAARAAGFSPEEIEASVIFNEVASDDRSRIKDYMEGEEIPSCEEVAEVARQPTREKRKAVKIRQRRSREWRLSNPRFKKIVKNVLRLCGYPTTKENFRRMDKMLVDWFRFSRSLESPKCSAVCNIIDRDGMIVKSSGRPVTVLIEVPEDYYDCPDRWITWAWSDRKKVKPHYWRIFSHWWGEGKGWNLKLSDKEYIDKYGPDKYSERLDAEQTMELVYHRGMTADEAIRHVETGEWHKEQEKKRDAERKRKSTKETHVEAGREGEDDAPFALR